MHASPSARRINSQSPRNHHVISVYLSFYHSSASRCSASHRSFFVFTCILQRRHPRWYRRMPHNTHSNAVKHSSQIRPRLRLTSAATHAIRPQLYLTSAHHTRVLQPLCPTCDLPYLHALASCALRALRLPHALVRRHAHQAAPATALTLDAAPSSHVSHIRHHPLRCPRS